MTFGQDATAFAHADDDPTAAERRHKFPPDLGPGPCHGCGRPCGPGEDEPADLCVARWVRYESRHKLASVLAVLAGVLFLYNRVLPHATYHRLCRGCVWRTRRRRLAAGAVRFVGLFLSAVGMIGTIWITSSLLLDTPSPRDRAWFQRWAWAPMTGLARRRGGHARGPKGPLAGRVGRP